jgi:hypothetical protein
MTWTMTGQLASGAESVSTSFMYFGWVYLNSSGVERHVHLGKLTVTTASTSVVGAWDGNVWSMHQLDAGVAKSAPIYSNMASTELMQIPVYYAAACNSEERTLSFLRYRPSSGEHPQLFMEQTASGAALVSEVPRASGGVIRTLLFSKRPQSTGGGGVRECSCAVDGSDYRGEVNTAISGETCLVSAHIETPSAAPCTMHDACVID